MPPLPVNVSSGNVLVAPAEERGEFLRMVGLWTMGGLLVAYTTGAVCSAAIVAFPVLLNQLLWIAIFFGTFFFSHYAARYMVWHGPKLLGFVLGCAAEGIALGYLMLFAVMVGAEEFGASGFAPFKLIAEAAGLTLLSCLGMVTWLWTKPRDLSMIRGVMCTAGPPMLVLMILTAVYPIGGWFGLAIGGVFVVVSAAGLLYNFNQVLHVMNTEQHLEAAYEITLGILVLFWNILVTLMRLAKQE